MPKLRARLFAGCALFLVIFPVVAPTLPGAPLPWVFPQAANAAEVVSSPEFIDVTVMPNGNVGMVFLNGAVPEIRFKRYFAEQGLDPSVQLSTTGAWYPQVATFKGQLIAAYVGSQSILQFRVSTDNGATWGPEFAPFGSETFDTAHWTPLLVTSRDGSTLYLFTVASNPIPMFRSTQDPTLATWTTPAAAGDATMHAATGDVCGSGECGRSHNFEFTENASGQWVYVTASTVSEEHWGCGRVTQVGTLGGSWSSPQFHGNTCDLSGFNGGSRATTFVGRDGSVYYVRALGDGSQVYYQKSTDGGSDVGRARRRVRPAHAAVHGRLTRWPVRPRVHAW